MKKAVLYSPGISSMNIGDEIIAESAKENLSFVLKNTFPIEISTHLPLSYYYMRHFKNAEYKFVLGSNLLKSTIFGFKKQWDINLRMAKITGPVVLVGVGWWQYNNEPNLYTKLLLKTILSKQYIHSVRDEYTLNMLKSIGITNVVNTACSTMWKLDKDHCMSIKSQKSSKVVFTLTDYNKNIEKDTILVKKLCEIYSEVFYWPQGMEDLEYINALDVDLKGITILQPTLNSFNDILDSNDIDYVGTRLHGGIRALQKKVRTLIIAIDNRAIEKHKTFNLPILNRDEIDKLNDILNEDIYTDIRIPEENIKLWKSQFE
ncbi:polysaccharide pyruvyl transferase family protein [Carnobacterium antarcticum]|uniref:Polysaccharide pyruvyl transferase family protein n=1 Tax=Carnobacterium antarcticum TaxID=2126436 RepID=A0ABW4NKI0_9LACT|nr:polysaccharide pyruvyl transferase family protein [Carnobacterium sp. CP1]ALV21537.1 hypothetical protein NY10_923 [Carnobacterium sp. CP1]